MNREFDQLYTFVVDKVPLCHPDVIAHPLLRERNADAFVHGVSDDTLSCLYDFPSDDVSCGNRDLTSRKDETQRRGR